MFEWYPLEEIEKNIVVIYPEANKNSAVRGRNQSWLSPLLLDPTDASNCTVPFASLYFPPGDSHGYIQMEIRLHFLLSVSMCPFHQPISFCVCVCHVKLIGNKKGTGFHIMMLFFNKTEFRFWVEFLIDQFILKVWCYAIKMSHSQIKFCDFTLYIFCFIQSLSSLNWMFK